MSVKVESYLGSKHGRTASMLLLAIAAIACISGCDKPTAPAVQARSAGGESDPKFLATLKKAKVGDAEAQRALARMYDHGEGVPKNAVKAFEWRRPPAFSSGTVWSPGLL